MLVIKWDDYRRYAEVWEVGYAIEKLQELFELVTKNRVILVVRREHVSEVPPPILDRSIVILV